MRERSDRNAMTDRKRTPRPMPLPASPFVSPARSIADLATGPIADLAGRRGLAGADIIAHWRAIVGDELADACAPEKIAWPRAPHGEEAGGVLHVRVDGPLAVEVQHRADEILARVNQMFGYAALARLRIVQAPLPGRDRPPPRTPHAPAGPAAEDGGDLAAALARLARAVHRK